MWTMWTSVMEEWQHVMYKVYVYTANRMEARYLYWFVTYYLTILLTSLPVPTLAFPLPFSFLPKLLLEVKF